jgi:hypothetical protein
MQSDDYKKNQFLFNKIGITHLVPCHHIHQHNGATKWKQRHTLLKVGLSLLAKSYMPIADIIAICPVFGVFY